MELLYKKEAFDIVGACMEVHKELGSGFLEAVYHEALLFELSKREIPFQTNVKLKIEYKGKLLNKVYYADVICYDKIIVELKAMNALVPEHESQVVNYLKATDFQLGILVNFGALSLQYKRLILTN